jgi:DNA-binding transcriptional ArsR family regulator
MAKSTLSNHFRILREAGILCSRREGTQYANCLRLDDLDARFPGLLDAILDAAKTPGT